MACDFSITGGITFKPQHLRYPQAETLSSASHNISVIPAQAGIQQHPSPACAGTTIQPLTIYDR